MLDGFSFLSLADYIFNQSRHALFAFETVALDAFEALSVRFIPKLPFFVRLTHQYIFSSIPNQHINERFTRVKKKQQLLIRCPNLPYHLFHVPCSSPGEQSEGSRSLAESLLRRKSRYGSFDCQPGQSVLKIEQVLPPFQTEQSVCNHFTAQRLNGPHDWDCYLSF